LLPGLEESQGALYEIGVADDGTFVGLTEDELDESLTTLQTMAASLGCKVEIQRRVIVGKCEWAEDSLAVPPDPTKCRKESLWVAEALVSPDLDFYNLSSARTKNTTAVGSAVDAEDESAAEEDSSNTEQIRISLTGPSASGKSSLLGTLTSSSLDNGRGSSRLSLLKHRHEISSGVTSSVAQELIGYTGDVPPTVINYASGNVAAWDDIHAASRGGRLAFVSDLPGSVRYLKSTLRGLVSWAPHYVMLCIPANCGDETADTESGAESAGDIDRCLAYLDLCLKLEVNIIIVITKLDVASRGGLRENLAKVLSALKTAGRKPAMQGASPAGNRVLDLQQVSVADSSEVQKNITAAEGHWSRTVPIVLASAVDGTGIGKLHAFLRHLPIPARPSQRRLRIAQSLQRPANVFDVDEVFAIPPSKVYSASTDREGRESRGMVLCGLVRHGSISIGDEMTIGPILVDTSSDGGSEPAPLSLLSRSSGPGQSGEFPASLSHSVFSGKDASIQAKWQRVRVVSVRDLRLPVRRLKEDQVGTIGIELLASPDEGRLPRLGRIRKGMVLIDLHTSLHPRNSLPSSLPSTLPLPFHTGFTATFPASEFSAPNSPPLLLGGNAIAYIANIRTTVRVVCMALAGTGDEPGSRSPSPSPSPTEPEFFSFDGDTQTSSSPGKEKGSSASHTNGIDGSMRGRPSAMDISKVVAGTGDGPSVSETFKEDVKITFGLVTSVEWIELGSQVLVMPGMSMSASSGVAVTPAPSSGAGNASGSGIVSMSGLEGFVGSVCEVVPGRSVGSES
jgi:GTPase